MYNEKVNEIRKTYQKLIKLMNELADEFDATVYVPNVKIFVNHEEDVEYVKKFMEEHDLPVDVEVFQNVPLIYTWEMEGMEINEDDDIVPLWEFDDEEDEL